MKKVFYLTYLLTVHIFSMAQRVGINTNNPQAALDISSTTQGVLMPRLTSLQRDAMTGVAEGTIIYNTTVHCLQIYNGMIWSCTNGNNKSGMGKHVFPNNNSQTTNNADSFDKTADNGMIFGGHLTSNSTWYDPTTGLPMDITIYDAIFQKLDSTGTTLWLTKLNGAGYVFDIHEVSTGGYIAVGANYWISNIDNATATKLNANGDTVWTKSYGGTLREQFNSVTELPDGNFIAVGSATSNNGDVSGNHGNTDIWVVKINGQNGSIIWQKCFGGTSDDDGRCIKALPGGNFVLVGNSNSNDGDFSGNHGNGDGCIIKCYESGIGPVPFFTRLLGGSNTEYFLSIDITNDGAFIIAGKTASNDGHVMGLHNGNAEYNPWILKLDDAFGNNIIWQKCINSVEDFSSFKDEAVSIKRTNDNGFIVAISSNGGFQTIFGSADVALLKLTNTGVQSWATIIGSSGIDKAMGVIQNNSGNYILLGNFKEADFFITDKGFNLFKVSNSGTIKNFTN